MAFAPIIPVYYAGGGTAISFSGRVAQGVAPTHCELVVFATPNILHVHVKSDQATTVKLVHPNGTTQATWRNETISEKYVLSECGLWNVYVSESSNTPAQGEIYTTAPLLVHPALIYASGLILLGFLSLLHSNSRRKQRSYFKGILFEQNIGGRWVFWAWIPILITTAQAPVLIPSYPWLSALLLAVTVIAVFSSISLAYVKLYVLTKGILIEAPFLNLSRYYETNHIYGFAVTREKKQRWFLLRPIPSREKENQVTISTLNPLPKRLWILSLSTRLYGNKIIFRPKDFRNFTSAMDKAGISRKESSLF